MGCRCNRLDKQKPMLSEFGIDWRVAQYSFRCFKKPPEKILQLSNYCCNRQKNSQQHSVDSKLFKNFLIRRKFDVSELTSFSTPMLWSRVLSRHIHWCWRSQRPPELHTQSELLEMELTLKWQSHGAYGSTTSSGFLGWRLLPSVSKTHAKEQ